jgi:hypothetical protein
MVSGSERVSRLKSCFCRFARLIGYDGGMPKPQFTLKQLLLGPPLIIVGLRLIYGQVTGDNASGQIVLGLDPVTAIGGGLIGIGVSVFTELPWYFLMLVGAILSVPIAFILGLMRILYLMSYHGH